jgi:hypothetical protein
MFDMSKCKIGDKLITRGGTGAVFKGVSKYWSEKYPYAVQFNGDASIYSCGATGIFWEADMLSQWDIVGAAVADIIKFKRVRKPKPIDDGTRIAAPPSAFDTALERAMMIYVIHNSKTTTPAYIWVAYIKDCIQTFNKAMKSRDTYKGLDSKLMRTARRT